MSFIIGFCEGLIVNTIVNMLTQNTSPTLELIIPVAYGISRTIDYRQSKTKDVHNYIGILTGLCCTLTFNNVK